MSQEILVPFGLDAHGSVQVTSDPDIQAMQHVRSLAATEPGERVMLPTYGIPLRHYVFTAGLPMVTARIHNDVSMAMAAWEPNINVLGILPHQDSADGVASIDVDFTRGTTVDASAFATATVLIGGTVVEGTSP